MSLQYKNLVVWQRADDLFISIHRLRHQQFPSDERYELGRQLRRAAHSVPSNIVKGNARQHTRDKLNFFNIASASLSEVTYGLHAARRLGYIDEDTYRSLDDLTRMVAAPLNGLIKKHRATQVMKVVSVLGFSLLATPILS